MKILLINNSPYSRGGADTVYLNTAELLSKNGHEVFLFSLYESDISEFFVKRVDYRSSSFINKIKSAPSFIYNREAYLQLLRLIDRVKPDVAHIHLFMGGLTTSILLALKNRNIPIVHSVHDYRLICPAYTLLDRKNNICERCKDKFYLRCAIRRCSYEKNIVHSTMLSLDAYFRKYIYNPINYIDKFIFTSHFSKNKHVEFNANYESNSVVLYNFSNNPIVKSVQKGNYFLFFGRHSREKGLPLLIEAAHETNISLKVCGEGPLTDELRRKNYSNIEFLGYINTEELRSVIAGASFIVVPSETYENNPLAVIEAFSNGKPVIGSRLGGITELIEDSRGFLFEPKNKASLVYALNEARHISQGDYIDMSRKAYKFSENNFSDEKHYKKLLEIYKSLVK